jgi:AcrR family transcriptional regulator
MPKRNALRPRDGSTGEQLISAVLHLLLEDGADAVTVGAVAQRADVALRTVYNHFSSREALLEAALDRIISEIEAALAAAGIEDGPPDERIRRFVAAAFGEFDRLGILLTRILSVRGVPHLERRLATLNEWRRARIEDIVDAAEAEGVARLGAVQANALAGALIGHGSWEALVQTGGLNGRRAGELLGRALANALTRPEASLQG